MKQIVSILFLLLANVVLMAHAVVPHHHHDDHVCFEHNSCTSDHAHEDDNEIPLPENDDDCCLLSGKLVFTPSAHTNEISCHFCSLTDHSQWFINLSVGNPEPSLLLSPTPLGQPPFNDSHYLSFASHCYGLRAPPVIA